MLDNNKITYKENANDMMKKDILYIINDDSELEKTLISFISKYDHRFGSRHLIVHAKERII